MENTNYMDSIETIIDNTTTNVVLSSSVSLLKESSDNVDGDSRSKGIITHRRLTKLHLHCWQREYAKRPYLHFIFHGQLFKRKFHRKMDEDDFLVILTFLDEHFISNLELIHSEIPSIHVPYFLKCLSNIVNLNLSYTPVPLEFYVYLADHGRFLNLKTLRLSGNVIYEPQSEYLRQYLMETKKLFYFDLSNCYLNHITLATIADGITHCVALKSIDLSNIVPCHAQHAIDSSKISSILSIIVWMNPLMEVNFQNCFIDAFGMESIAENIAHTCLRILNISGNNIGPDGTEVLFKALKHSCIAALDISKNNIGPIGGHIISECVSYTKLQYLDVSYNQIPAEKMELILAASAECISFKILNVQGNEFNSATGDTIHRLMSDKILSNSGLDVDVVYDEYSQGYQVAPTENKLLSNCQDFLKVSRYCLDNKINPKTMLWFRENIRHIVSQMVPIFHTKLNKFASSNL